jgi:hypothetical protein
MTTMNHRAKKKPQISPLRYATVEMANLLQGHDYVSMMQHRQSLKKIVISTGGIREQWATQGDERSLLSSNCFPWPATALHGTATLPFVIPSVAEGSAVPRIFPGNVFDTTQRNAEACNFNPCLEKKPIVLKQTCHLDRSAAEWRDLRFPFRFSRRHQSPHTRIHYGTAKAVPFVKSAEGSSGGVWSDVNF